MTGGRHSFTKWALAPIHLAALATGAKSFRDNPIIGNPTLNRMGLHVSRVRLAHAAAQHRRRSLRQLVNDADAEAFDRDGFVVKNNFLPSDTFKRLQEEVFTYRGNAREMLQGDAITRRILLSQTALKRMPSARNVIHDPAWLRLVQYVASSRLYPACYIQTIFSKVVPHTQDPQTFLHADTFHSTVKAWLLLHDVGEADGPFIYVPGSHRRTEQRLNWELHTSINAANADFLTSRGSLRISPPELSELDLPAPRLCAYPANTLIVADTSGFHGRALTAEPSTRVELWAYGRQNPYLPFTSGSFLAPYVLTNLVASGLPKLAHIRPLLGLPAGSWRPISRIGALGAPDIRVHTGRK